MLATGAFLFSCDKVGTESPDEPYLTIPRVQSEVLGFYVLNQGGWGANNSTLDYVDLRNGRYITDYFGKQNPDMAYGLGDTGNDMLLTDDYLIMVLNGSNLLEVTDAHTAKHITAVEIPQCRSIIEADGCLYVTSYADEGTLYKVSMSDWSVTGKIQVGHDPEQLHYHDGFIYVLNSGGLTKDDSGQTAYEQTISVVDVSDFTVDRTVDTGYRNLYKILCTGETEYVIARGDYGADPGAVFSYDRRTDEVKSVYGKSLTNWCLYDGTVYTHTTAYDGNWNSTDAFGKITDSGYKEESFLNLSGVNLSVCYGLEINPATGDFVIFDAGDYTNPGKVHYFNADGSLSWSVTAGVSPCKAVWVFEDSSGNAEE